MQPRFVGRLGVADGVTVANAALGFLAAVAATVEPRLAAQLVLLAAIADGLDGVIARKLGSTPTGEYLDSLADVASFGVAPAVLVFAVAREQWSLAEPSLAAIAAFCVPALFVAMAVVRLGLYTAYEVGNAHTVGVPTTLSATVLSAAVLADVAGPALLLGATGLFAYLMVTSVTYPDLYARDALAMGGVQAIAVLAPTAFGRAFPLLLLGAALAYLLLGPRYYWREVDAHGEDARGAGAHGTNGEEARRVDSKETRRVDDEAVAAHEAGDSGSPSEAGVAGADDGDLGGDDDETSPNADDREVEGKRS